MNKINFRDKRLEEHGIALFEIFILIISIFTFAYFIGNEFKFVGAAGEEAALTIEEALKILQSFPTPPAATVPSSAAATIGGEAAAAATPSGVIPGGPGMPGGLAEGVTPGLVETPFWQTGFGKFLVAVKVILFHAAVAAALLFSIKFLLGLIPDITEDAVWKIAGTTAGAYLIASLISSFVFKAKLLTAMTTGLWWALPALILAFLIFFEKQFKEARIFTSYTWAPPQGGKYCYKCGEGIIPCTKYQCQSLGESCEFLKEGEGEGICIHTNPNDIEPPVIKPWEEALKNSDYSYSPDDSISPPDRGVIVKYKNLDCGIPGYEIFSFGVQLINDLEKQNPKLGKCKYSFTRKDSYEEMPDLFLSNRMFKYNHSISFKLPGVENLKAEDIEDTGEHTIYVRCENRNGYANDENFVFKFCIDKGRDTQAPIIEETNPSNGKPIQYGLTSIETEIFTNEPSDCKWSHNDEDYNTMLGTMSCSQNMIERNANMLYRCTTTLTGLKDGVENKFYFRCKDQPVGVADADRNVNPTSYLYILIGTRPLVIESVSPESGAVIKDSTQSVKVTLKAVTSAGYKDGQAGCWYKKKLESEKNYILFFNTNSYQSTQDLWLPRGSYKYSIKCCDLGGNCATKETDFSVDTDFLSPMVVRAYSEGSSLKIVTNENAECVYDTTSCSYNFDDGIKMISSDNIAHTTDWNTNSNFYIKCKDEFGNQPAPDGCSITVRPFNVY